jgi:hypothetical protein
MRMTPTFKLARRIARLRSGVIALLTFALGGCGNPDRVTNTAAEEDADPAAVADTPVEVEGTEVDDGSDEIGIADEDEALGDDEDLGFQVEVVDGPDGAVVSMADGLSLASAYRGGIPFGVFHLPVSQYGKNFSGSLVNTSSATRSLVPVLTAAKRAGVKVVISLVGAEHYYKNSNGTFSLAKWKKRVDAYRRVNLSSFIKDGTIIGHYILDEPHDPSNWAGRTVSRATVDEMARYSKSIWPSMPTIVRGWPAYLKGYNYRYLDAAWAQYSARFGNVSTWLKNNVRDAKASRLALVVGLNQLQGGAKGGLNGFYRRGFYSMSASQMRSWGAAILADPYPCAFLSWAYNTKYLKRSDIKSAKTYLAGKARSRATKSCRAGSHAGGGSNSPPPDAGGSGGGGTASSIKLRVTGRSTSGRQYMTLTWSGVRGSTVDIYRDGKRLTSTKNDGRYVNVRRYRGRISYTYKTCQRGTNTCSSSVRVSFH